MVDGARANRTNDGFKSPKGFAEMAGSIDAFEIASQFFPTTGSPIPYTNPRERTNQGGDVAASPENGERCGVYSEQLPTVLGLVIRYIVKHKGDVNEYPYCVWGPVAAQSFMVTTSLTGTCAIAARKARFGQIGLILSTSFDAEPCCKGLAHEQPSDHEWLCSGSGIPHDMRWELQCAPGLNEPRDGPSSDDASTERYPSMYVIYTDYQAGGAKGISPLSRDALGCAILDACHKLSQRRHEQSCTDGRYSMIWEYGRASPRSATSEGHREFRRHRVVSTWIADFIDPWSLLTPIQMQ